MDFPNNSSNISAGQPYEEFKNQSRFACQRVILPVVCTIGIIVNCLTILIFSQRKLKSSTNMYLRALAVCDLIYLASILILTFENYPDRHPYYLYYLPYGYFITDFMSNSSVCLTAAFTVERFLVVGNPMKHMKYANSRTAQKVIILIVSICFIATLSTVFENKVVSVYNNCTNSSELQIRKTELGKSQVYQNVFFWSVTICFMFIPFILIASLNVFLILSLRAARTVRSSLSPAAIASESRTTFLLVVIVLMFLICQLPTAVMLIVSLSVHIPENLFRGLNNFLNLLVVINATANFFLYVGLSVKFRRTFIELLFSRVKLRKLRSMQIPDRYYLPTRNATVNGRV